MMKWWGWGDPDFTFPLEHRPLLMPWIERTLGLGDDPREVPVPREQIHLPPSAAPPELMADLRGKLGSDAVLDDDDERLLHAAGKSYPDLLRMRRGEIRRAPDVVTLPGGHDDVTAILDVAAAHGATVVPFGGGTNIVGGVNPDPDDPRPVICVDLRRMNKVLAIDPVSHLATIQGGALGPKLEEDLERQGFSLGHHPDSFQFSTLGGWLATRSAGMQSDAYGKIEDMVVALSLATPRGVLTTRNRPRAATGPDLNQLAVGSEGILGIITEATMRVHETPEVRDHHGLLFPTFSAGVEAMQQCVRAGCGPSLFRLSDAMETELSMHMKPPSHGFKAILHRAMKRVLAARGYTRPCLMIAGFEGPATRVPRWRRAAFKILKRSGGIHVGKRIGRAWSKEKYNLPYLRDVVMDRGVAVDVAETAAPWSKVLPLYDATVAAMSEAFSAHGRRGYIGCHVSHTYATGACLYFTWAVRPDPGQEILQYYGYKRLVTETFLAQGGALSHHHAIGIEHRPWMREEIGPTGIRALRGLKTTLDPDGIMNPGKLIPDP